MKQVVKLGVGLAMALAGTPALAKAETKAALGVAFQFQNNRVEVADIMPGSAGAQMGILPGDVITHAGGKPMKTQTRLTAFLSKLKVGDPVEITVKRKGQVVELKGTAMARTW